MLYIGNYDKISAQNMSKLNDFLLKNGVSPTRYAIGISMDDKLCLDRNQKDKRWSVYYQERGSKMCYMQYPTFRKAARVFVNRLVPIKQAKDAREQFDEQFGVTSINKAAVRKYAKVNSQNDQSGLVVYNTKANQIGHQWGVAASYSSISEIQCSNQKKKRLKKRDNELQ